MTSAERALALLTKLAAIPRVSRHEAEAVAFLERELFDLGLAPRRVGRNLLCTLTRGRGPRLMLNSHIDTVPPAHGYTRDPHAPAVESGCLYGLGVNDAGASVAAMSLAAWELSQRRDWQGSLELALVVEEEVNGKEGSEFLLAELGMPDAAIVGEPTALDVCVAQKGLVVLDCVNTGEACHVAHAHRLAHQNAILAAARDMEALASVRFAASDPALGPTTLQVTQIAGGVAHNTIPDRCAWVVDARVNPAQGLDEIAAAVQARVQAQVTPRSLRLQPVHTDAQSPLVQATLRARPAAKVIGSDTMSDMVFFRGVPVIKCGPGSTDLSHRPNEYVEVRWIQEAITTYVRTAVAFAPA